MTDQPAPDRAIERLLRTGAVSPLDPQSFAACVDAETLAVWADGRLPAAERDRIESHVADCARCQSMFAAFARTEPPAALTQVPWWRRAEIRWLVPLATAATVAAIWVVVPERAPQSVQDTVAMAPAQSELNRAPAAEPAPTTSAPRAPFEAAPPPEQSRAAKAAPSPTPSARALPPAAPPPVTVQDQQPIMRRAEPPPPAAAAEPAREALAREQAEKRVAEATPPRARDTVEERTLPAPVSAASPPPPPAPAAPKLLQESAASAERAAQGAVPGQRVLGATSAAGAQNAIVMREIVAPGGATRWRIVRGTLERSTNAGETWERVRASPALLQAGHAPSPSIAWFVGGNGSVFLTRDGSRFDRLPFPASVDLVGVTAVDDREATVTTADGRQFHTGDAGKTWTAR